MTNLILPDPIWKSLPALYQYEVQSLPYTHTRYRACRQATEKK